MAQLLEQLGDILRKKSRHMKLAAFVTVFTIASHLNADAQTALRISLADNTPITVAVDGRYFNTRGTSVTVADIPYGRHYVKVFAHSQRNNRGYEQIVYEGRIKTYRGHATLLSVDAYTGRTVSSQIPLSELASYNTTAPTTNPPSQTNDRPYAQPQGQQGTAAEPDTALYPSLPPGTPLASPVSVDELETELKGKLNTDQINAAKSEVDAANGDSEKLKSAKRIFAKCTFTAEQVSMIMPWFSFESTRVDFAKWAYSRTTDKQGYSKIIKALTIDGNRRDLTNYIKKGK